MLRMRKSWTSVFESPARSRRPEAASPSQVASVTAAPEQAGSATNLCVRIARHWYRDGSASDPFRPKCPTEDEIQGFEQRNNILLPADLREYFLRLNGIDMDPGLFRFWPLSRLIQLKSPSGSTCETGRYFIFADYMVGTWYYAIYLTNDSYVQNHVILPDFPGRPVIAHSFSEFVELYLADSPMLYGNQ